MQSRFSTFSFCEVTRLHFVGFLSIGKRYYVKDIMCIFYLYGAKDINHLFHLFFSTLSINHLFLKMFAAKCEIALTLRYKSLVIKLLKAICLVLKKDGKRNKGSCSSPEGRILCPQRRI